MITGKKILVVDDDEVFRFGVEMNLKKSGYGVAGAPTADGALAMLKADKYDVVVADIRMPGMDGVELMRQIKAQHEGVRVILMTGFSEILETKSAHELGADAFLAKPFQREELQAAIVKAFSDKAEAMDDKDFCRIYLDDFTTGSQIQYDIFIRLAPSKYVKIANSGIDLSIERIKSYKSKGVRYLYLLKEDFRKYVGFLALIAKGMKTMREKIPEEARQRFMKHTSDIIMEQLYREQIDEDFFENARTFIESTVDLLGDTPDIFMLLEALNEHVDYLYSHSVGTSLYGVMIARAMGWISPTNMFKIALGGLLHDIGKKEIDREILRRPRSTWNTDEVKLYESHPIRGVSILEQLHHLPEDVLLIVKSHHEDCIGRGFPEHLVEKRIHPLARLVAVSNEFCRLVLKTPDGPGMPVPKAIAHLSGVRGAALDQRFFRSLSGLCRVNPIAP